MKNLKYLLPIVLVSLFITLQPTNKVQAYSGTGLGTEQSPYIITTCAQLVEIDDDADAYYNLGTNIDCSVTTTWNYDNEHSRYEGFMPLGDMTWFTGILDGKGYTISNMYINRQQMEGVGLFEEANSATIKNLNIDGWNLTGEAMVGTVAGWAGIEIDNVHVTNTTLIATDGVHVGGLIGYSADSAIIDSSFNGTITGVNRVGGLVGYEEEYIEITDSYNLGTINGYVRTGGLVGSIEGEGVITGSYNQGSVNGNVADTDAFNYRGIGGLIGAVWKLTMSQSYNTGTITTDGGYSYVGGLVGCGGLANIEESYNTGELNIVLDGNGMFSGVGGIVGSTINVTIENSYNSGDIEASLTDPEGNTPPLGGLVGFTFVSSITNSYNSGDIEQADQGFPWDIGGLIGDQMFDSNFIGGIISDTGKTFVDKGEYILKLINNFSVGNIVSFGESIVGGLIGALGYNYEGYQNETIFSNNWWTNSVTKAIGWAFDYGAQLDISMEDESEGHYQREAIMEGFKTYSHKVYNTNPDWDFNTIWSSAYEGRGYPVLAFHKLLAPNKPSANFASGAYTGNISLVLTSTASTKIMYTTDGSTPTCTVGSLYTSPLTISSTCTLKAIGCNDEGLGSVLGEFSYVISTAPIANNPIVRPRYNTVSLVNTILEEQNNTETENTDAKEVVTKKPQVKDANSNEEITEEKKFGWWWILVAVGGITVIYIIYRRYRQK
jgi:hypothetical protein